MKIQELHPYFEQSTESKKKILDLLTEALTDMNKAGEELRKKGINVKDYREVFDYAVALSQFTAIYEVGQGVDLDGDAKEEVKAIVEEKKKIEGTVTACPEQKEIINKIAAYEEICRLHIKSENEIWRDTYEMFKLRSRKNSE